MNKNGFIISTDSFLGLTAIAFIIIISFFYLSQISLYSWDSVHLINSARDVSIVLEKSNSLQNSVLLNSNELITQKLNSTPENICFEVLIFESDSSNPKMIALKSGCVKFFREKFAVDRSFIVQDDFYLAKVQAWYK